MHDERHPSVHLIICGRTRRPHDPYHGGSRHRPYVVHFPKFLCIRETRNAFGQLQLQWRSFLCSRLEFYHRSSSGLLFRRESGGSFQLRFFMIWSKIRVSLMYTKLSPPLTPLPLIASCMMRRKQTHLHMESWILDECL